jgi:Ca2+-transporting ATPase
VASLAGVALIIQLIQGVNFLAATEFTLAMIVSAVPEGLPIAISVILALGAKRMAKKHALVKEMRAIESIGIVTTIASDKTGTLTENKLFVTGLWQFGDKRKNFVKMMAMSALPDAISSDALDMSIIRYLKERNDAELVPDDGNTIDPARSYAFDQASKISGNLYNKNYVVIKGAPEAVIERCGLGDGDRQKVLAEMNKMTAKGHKVIAIADAKLNREVRELSNLDKDDKFNFLGLISVADKMRREAPEAIAEARRAGVKVKMITGDHWQTAYEIGKGLGLVEDESEVFDCSKMGSITDDDFEEILQRTTVFARVTPEDKFRLLTLMKKHEVTAMTGDGVNDVPALTNAHIGIAMGSGPSIVQDAGDIVLLDDNFKNIVAAMKEGRVVLTNIRRMLVYVLSTNAGEALTIIAALLMGGGQLLLPIQILWVNLVTDSLMLLPIGLEPPEEYYMKQKPESKNAPILNAVALSRMLMIAVTVAGVTLAVFFIASEYFSREQANTLAFTALVVMQWANAFNVRGSYESAFKRIRVRSWKFWAALSGAIILQVVAVFTPLGHQFLGIVDAPLLPLMIVALVAFAVPIVVVELHKLYVVKFAAKSA